jgi:hypothetical protein
MTRPSTSASNLHRRSACPGSANAESKFPQEPDNEDSAEGNHVHKLLANPSVERTGESDEVQWLCSAMDRQTAEIQANIFGLAQPKIHREITLHLNDEVFGHADFVAIHAGVALVIDYKCGRNPVDDTERNLQLRAYAVCVAQEFMVSDVYCAIVQPRIDVGGQRAYPVAHYTDTVLETCEKQIEFILSNCEKPDAPLQPDVEACRYCRARHDCEALKEKSGAVATINASEIAFSKAAEVLRTVRLFETRAKAIKQSLFRMVSLAEAENRIIPGLCLKPGKMTREITDAQKAFSAVASVVTDSEFRDCVDVSVVKLEKVFKAKTGLKSKDAKIKLAECLNASECYQEKRSAPHLEFDNVNGLVEPEEAP